MSQRTILKHFLEEKANKDPNEFAGFKSSIWFRNYLIEFSVPSNIANRLAIKTDFVINEKWTDEEIKEVIEPYARIISNLVKEYIKNGFSDEDVYIIAKDLSIEF